MFKCCICIWENPSHYQEKKLFPPSNYAQVILEEAFPLLSHMGGNASFATHLPPMIFKNTCIRNFFFYLLHHGFLFSWSECFKLMRILNDFMLQLLVIVNKMDYEPFLRYPTPLVCNRVLILNISVGHSYSTETVQTHFCRCLLSKFLLAILFQTRIILFYSNSMQHLPCQERKHCSWTGARRRRWKTFLPWGWGRAGQCWVEGAVVATLCYLLCVCTMASEGVP